jgi:hypothetical protein
MILSPIDSLRTFYDNLNPRERTLVNGLGVVMTVVVVFLPMWLVWSAITSLGSESEEVRAALTEIARSQEEIAVAQAAQEAARRRYDQRAPALGSFLEEHARRAGYERPLQVSDQPAKVARGFTRRQVRASLPGVDLKAAVDMMTAVENSRYPIAFDTLRIEHFQSGDRYNVEVGVITFDRATDEESGDSDEPAAPSGGRAGPPRR